MAMAHFHVLSPSNGGRTLAMSCTSCTFDRYFVVAIKYYIHQCDRNLILLLVQLAQMSKSTTVTSPGGLPMATSSARLSRMETGNLLDRVDGHEIPEGIASNKIAFDQERRVPFISEATGTGSSSCLRIPSSCHI